MGERKVLNKYYPPDFDPSKIPRTKKNQYHQIKVRMMLPMSIRCNTCGNYIYKGTKFNSRKEDAAGENYLGIQIVRLYFKCTRCSAELAIKTDPKNSDYIVEAGATRNFEPWRDKDEEVDREKRKREEQELGDAMKSLENRTLDSKREMDIMSALDEVKSIKSRHAGVSVDDMLKALQPAGGDEDEDEDEDEEQKLAAEDEALIKSIFHAQKEYVRRIDDDESDDDDGTYTGTKRRKAFGDVSKPTDILANSDPSETPNSSEPSSRKPTIKTPPVVTFVVKKKQPQKQEVKEAVVKEDKKNNADYATPLSLCCYDSDDDE